MTDEELFTLFASHAEPPWHPVIVTAADYSYKGWLVSVFQKRRGNNPIRFRCVVEDDSGRLFIHNAGQLSEA